MILRTKWSSQGNSTMKKRIQLQDGNKDAAVVFLTMFHSDLQKRLKEKQDEDRISDRSYKFANDFSEVLRRCFGNDKVQAESVYMQYMLHKGSVHIAKTRWKTLEDFVKYQGRLGTFLVEYNNKIWYVQAQPKTFTEAGSLPTSSPLHCSDIVSSNNFRERFQCALKKLSQFDATLQKAEMNRHTVPKSIATKIDTKSQMQSSSVKKEPNTKPDWPLRRSKVEFKVSPRTSPYSKDRTVLSKHQTTSSHSKTSVVTQNRKSALAEIMEEEEKIRERKNRTDQWLQPGIIVRIVTDKYGRQNNRKRCRIVGMLSPCTGVGHVFATDAIIAVDQKHLQTCVPEVGKLVRIVNGAYRNEKGVVERTIFLNAIDKECYVRITGSPLSDFVKGPADVRAVENVRA